MNPVEFASKWSRVELPERAASQEHFLDLCRLLGQPTPAEHDSTGAEYTFEKGVTTAEGQGYADAWWRGKFAVEYKKKGKYKTLEAAYQQLLRYREALENPPLLVVCDIARIEIHTNFTGTKKQTHIIELAEIAEPEKLDLLRRMFTDPESFRPTVTAAKVTEQVAGNIGELAQRLRDRGHDPHEAAHFLMKVMFCLFAEDVNLLPKDRLADVLAKAASAPERLKGWLDDLFGAMASKDGFFWGDSIAWFNGSLFDRAPALELDEAEIELLRFAAAQDWGAVEPAIFGTLFERSLDPSKRAQIGAHYTSREDIMLVIEPVILRPLRRQWDDARAACEEQVERRRKATTGATKRKADEAINKALQAFMGRLAEVRVLDPACGSGNFLYVAIQQLLGLEKEVITWAARPEIGVGLLPNVRPTQLHGIEINPYAAELAQVVIWIGYLQWMRDNGFNVPRDPILSPLTTIECRDAILKWHDESGQPIPAWREGATCAGVAEWPEAEFIVGNPPFLGTKMLRAGLGDEYVEHLYQAYSKRIPPFSDLCCYWFELAREDIAAHPGTRAGLLATQAIRNDRARRVLERIKESGDIFMAWDDQPWVLDGAAVQISIVGFDDGRDGQRELDGQPIQAINADLTSGVDVGLAEPLDQNKSIGFVGDVKGGPFDVPWESARKLLGEPTPNGHSPMEVIRPYVNGRDITKRPEADWVIDFGRGCEESDAAGFGAAFEHAKQTVKPAREAGRPTQKRWWLHMRPCPSMRDAVEPLPRFAATPVLTKYRLFTWMRSPSLPDHQLIAFARSDDYFFGVLHSSVHELWARRQGTQLREMESGFRYTPTTCFETFPLPWAPGAEPAEGEPGRAEWQAISDAARELDVQRERWLNPPEWVSAIAAKVDAADDFGDVAQVSGEEARRLIRQSAIDAASAKDPRLKKRTLTNLYNERPTWLRLAHRKLDEAVLAAYALVDPAGGWDPAWAEVFEETGAGRPLPEGHALAEERARVEQAILGNLLRMNGERAGAG
ncbi:MAG: class I SAM-dependent DNA methyltransferase [Phycisphaerales bacterium JB039]